MKEKEDIKKENASNIDKAMNVLMFVSYLIFIFGMIYLSFNGIEIPFARP